MAADGDRQKGVRAGATWRDISPPRPLPLYGYPHTPRVSTGIHDPLLANVLVLGNGVRRVVIVSLEVLMIAPTFARELRREVATIAECEEAAVLLGCTHTHSGPVTSELIAWRNDPNHQVPHPEYLALIKQQLLAATREAVNRLQPAELAWCSADAAGVGGNRLSDDGVTDPECGVLALRQADSRALLAVLMIYGMHPTVMHEDSTLVSADFPAYARKQLREHFGCMDLTIAYLMAPAGNQSPRRFVTGQTFAEAERLGRQLGGSVIRSLPGPGWQSDVELAAHLTHVDLVRNQLRPLAEAKRLLAEYQAQFERLKSEGAPRADVRTAECAVFGAEGTLALAQVAASSELNRHLTDYDPAEVQVLRIGETCLAGIPGEYFTEYALEIKRRATRPVHVATLVNGELQGYIVTPEAAANGGYEATNAVFAPASGERIVEAITDQIKQLEAS